ncbi:MAG TPA: hypothetical protein EYH56_00575 [Nanoarchaeota archaeon]|nr:hypothetical protein [Nanoarchaeota archaeon]
MGINFKVCKKHVHVFILVLIFFLAFYIRALSIVPERILSYDPVYMYRFTKYFADWGVLPIWDELSYYVGRADIYPPFMFYLTALIYWIVKFFITEISLTTVCAWASAFYGALIVIPAYLLGKELSNRKGGIIASALVAFAPQILSRTFGSSYDTDQLVLFFILLTLYTGIRFLKNPNFYNFLINLFAFTGFMLTWPMFWYTYLIIVAIFVFSVVLGFVFKNLEKEKIKISAFYLFSTFVLLMIIGAIQKLQVAEWFFGLLQFATSPEVWIVNVSIAELQPVGFDIQTWIFAFGKFVTGLAFIDFALFFGLLFAIGFGIYSSLKKKDILAKSCFFMLFIFGLFTMTRGIRFTEFTSAIFLSLAGAGIGMLYSYVHRRTLRNFLNGIVLILIFIAFSTGIQLANYLGPDINSNWDNAWEFLKTQTPELALVGTWWDPGHMITGWAERRVIADGAHCGYACMYTINHRITDLGKIFCTNDENQAINLIRKYQGTSPKVYWIASADLIGKFQWLQYFGTGCDARYEWEKCPLYGLAYQTNAYYSEDGEAFLLEYGNIKVLNLNYPIAFYTKGRNAIIFKEIMFYENGNLSIIDLTQTNTTLLIEQLRPIFRNLGYRLSSQLLDISIWIAEDKKYVATIPPNLRNNMFTKMFFLEGNGLEKFKLVFRNPEVKIYEVIGLENKNNEKVL